MGERAVLSSRSEARDKDVVRTNDGDSDEGGI